MTVEVDELLLVCAFRYALGRATYIVGVVANDLIRLAPTLRDSTRTLITLEIDRAAAHGAIGMPMDHDEWMRVRDAMTAAEATS